MTRPRSAFPYQPLSQPLSKPFRGGFETRLVRLHPGAFDDCVYCTIYHANILERQPQTEYTALSYVWGDATRTKPIQLGYHQLPTAEPPHGRVSATSPGMGCYESFQVTTNLESALRHLRKRASERILWVDAICINQSDWEERLSQVEGMAAVYQNAVEVRIWLGSIHDVSVSTANLQEELENVQSRQVPIPGESSQPVLSPEEDTGAVSGRRRKAVETVLLAARDYIMDEGHLSRQETGDNWFPDELAFLGIQMIASRPWWRRVWVIQEATLPKQDPVMQCGRIEIKYRRFLESAKHCMFQNAPSELSRTQISLTVHGMFDDGHNPLEVSLANRLLAYLSCMSGNFEVTDPKDRINGVHGFLRMCGCHDNIFFYIFFLMARGKCEQSLAEYFHRVAIWILFDPQPESYPLRILESGPSNVEGLPSWVPMWESKKWIGRDKNHGAPESKYDILAQGTAMGKIYRRSTISVCDRCTAMYEKKWGAPKSMFDITVRCTEIRIRNALALGRVITTVEVHPVQRKNDVNTLRKAIVEVEQRIVAALRSLNIPHAGTKTHIKRFRDFVRLNFWDVDAVDGSDPSNHCTTLEDFLQSKRKSSNRKGHRRDRKVSAHRTDPSILSPCSIEKLGSFFGHVRHLVIGSNIVGHMFEESLPSWQCGDRLYLIPECRWVLGLRRSGIGYRYMYRVFVSDLEWQQRKQQFDGRGIYENIVLV
ncbi:hypothetical protein HBH70_076250 [Parastagonospora nodorum]|nr:hypothetical protein HBH50_105560 [Parastagonospora nodorum]KAH4090275.1 hypothetical protein HBH48_109330 [Parastagonospora nodorum]KAH5141784.1 hypothetical protein HBH70_076250 [Parastagonospora nodorum]